MDLFDYANEQQASEIAPLAERMRATSLDEFIGQTHIVGENSLLRRAIKADKLGSCIFYGPPGTGKTTLANIIAKNTDSHFEQLNAVAAGVADAKRVIEEAKDRLMMYNKRTYLLLDECHRWSKTQSDSVLSAIEQGYIIFIGSTTENPYVAMTKAIVSRCRLFEFKRLSDAEVIVGLKRAIVDKRGLGGMNVACEDKALSHLAWASGGDLRTAMNALELAVLTTSPSKNGVIEITADVASQSIQKRILSVDESGYYDMISAFCKSLRGSDSNAAVYWAMRLIAAGCDPMLILRRLVVHSAEDVGLANPNALNVAVSALTAFEKNRFA
jgi:ATPase related to the helicase subunit of the Holliday junction resolvase